MRLIAVIITILFTLFYGSLEIIKRKFNLHAEYTRKLAHCFSGIGALFSSFFLKQDEFLEIVFFFLLIFTLLYSKKSLKSISLKNRKTFGEIAYPLGLASLAYFVYHQHKIFIYGLLLLSFPDTLAGLIGRHFNPKRKTLAGSLAYFLSTLIIFATGFPWNTSLPFAILLTFIEYISPYGLDNFSIPLVYSLLATQLF
ncbi:hypothetical protein B5M47_02050 [candidate division CPR3 bacterium 4484_211]|uniref:Phosphatidate cytidylyltransferase n=1 Tax=candidate division CPR3 bacterium 4484_211 TaxID=1968527 RepID=A0A1W9NY22_UNCC3|nr:MAG: hypothetical protein B5M47_02050 [candidate division CPR3 bacterium 4484_211]